MDLKCLNFSQKLDFSAFLEVHLILIFIELIISGGEVRLVTGESHLAYLLTTSRTPGSISNGERPPTQCHQQLVAADFGPNDPPLHRFLWTHTSEVTVAKMAPGAPFLHSASGGGISKRSLGSIRRLPAAERKGDPPPRVGMLGQTATHLFHP